MTSLPPPLPPPAWQDAPPPAAAPTPAPAEAGSARLTGVDLARALAIIGMVSVHVAPFASPYPGPYGWAYGRASVLFAVVAGVGVSLLAARRPVGQVRGRLLFRAVWLFPAGLVLQGLDHPVAVILQFYAAWFLLTAAVVHLRTGWLAGLTGIGFVVGPTLLVLAEGRRPSWFAQQATDEAWPAVGDVLLSGLYPTISWWWVVLLGVLVGRLDLTRTRVAARLLAGGALLSVVAYEGATLLARANPGARALLDITGHADTTPEKLGAAGIAVAVIGGCLLLTRALPPIVLHPLVALGRVALTAYVAHLVVYDVAPSVFRTQGLAEATATTLGFAVVAAALATAWLAMFRRGPLEWLDHTVFSALRTRT